MELCKFDIIAPPDVHHSVAIDMMQAHCRKAGGVHWSRVPI